MLNKTTLILLMSFLCLTGCYSSKEPEKPFPNTFKYPYSSASEKNCSGSSTMELMVCLGETGAFLQKELDKTYQELKDFLKNDSHTLSDLETARTAWESHRSKNCQFISDYAYGGTFQKVYKIRCWNRMTQIQIEDVKAQLNFFKSHP